MLVREFARLVEVWRLVEKDPSTKEIHLDKWGAYIQGMHVEAARRSDSGVLPLDGDFSVDGPTLLGTVALFRPDAEIDLKQTEASLVISAGGRRAVLRRRVITNPIKQKLSFKADRFDSTRLRREMPFLRACVAGGVVQPVLTGIHVRPDGNRVILEATDASSRSGRVRISLPCRIPDQTIIPAADFEAALSLLDPKLGIRFSSRHIRLRDKTTSIKLSLLQPPYPDLGKLKNPGSYKHEVSLKKIDLEVATRAAVLLDSDRLVVFSVENRRGALLVRGQETGGFRQPVGRCDVPDIEIIFDAHWLDATQYIGDQVAMRYNDGRTPVLFLGSKRMLWMSPLVRS